MTTHRRGDDLIDGQYPTSPQTWPNGPATLSGVAAPA